MEDLSVRYVVSYKFRKGYASSDFKTKEDALKFYKQKGGSVYEVSKDNNDRVVVRRIV